MVENKRYSDGLVFGLDIGTRSIVGSVGYIEREKFRVIAHYVKEHDTRAMLDGQIHDIQKVGESILQVKKELEVQVGQPLTDVCIAAAGRVLKTTTVHVEVDLEETTQITSEHIYSLDLLGVEKAHDQIRMEESDTNFFCVGYSVVKYYLNDYIISNLEGHKGKKVAADVLATFLPDEVVDSLYAAVDLAHLQVTNLTLEPIAAIKVAIPEKFRLLNIALVDVGAGTSDISITRDGSIIAYGMIPAAGDEITESLVGEYLVDFQTAEQIKLDSLNSSTILYKDILDIEHQISAEEVIARYSSVVDRITAEIAEKIIELNGGKPVSAVFLVGGGGKAVHFTEQLAKYLDLPKERVALRGAEVLGNVDFLDEKVIKDPLLVTPIGICLNYFDQKNNFIFVNINDERIKLYNSNNLTVAHAAMQIGFPNEALFPRSGKELSFTVDGKERLLRGSAGEPSIITINGEQASINSPIQKNDRIKIIESTAGNPAECLIEQLPEYNKTITVVVNGKQVICPRFVVVNDKLVSGFYSIQSGDVIKTLNYYTVEQLFRFLDLDESNKTIYVNNYLASSQDKVYENFTVNFEEDYSEVAATNTINEPQPLTSTQTEMVVLINGSPIVLMNKTRYHFVDIFDFYSFDLSVPKGSNLVSKINGENCGYNDTLHEGDQIEIYWTN